MKTTFVIEVNRLNEKAIVQSLYVTRSFINVKRLYDGLRAKEGDIRQAESFISAKKASKQLPFHNKKAFLKTMEKNGKASTYISQGTMTVYLAEEITNNTKKQ